MNLIKAMMTVGGLTGVSRVAGFARDILTAAILGAGPVADAFFVALKLPNFFRRVTAEGAFSVSFIPVYTEILEKDGAESANKFAANMFMMMLVILSIFTALAIVFMPLVINLVAPGFNEDAERYTLAVTLSRISFPYLLLMSLTALLGGVMNALNRFAPFAIAPILFNVTLVVALLVSPLFETAGHALAYGISVSGAVQLVYLWMCASKSGVRIRFKKPEMTASAKKVLKLMTPGVIGAGVMHINLFVDMIIASFLPIGSISYLYYADRLNQLPLGVVGIAVGTALLPMLSRALSKGDNVEGQNLFNRAIEICLLLAVPAAVALACIPDTLMHVLFQRGEFTAADADISAQVLMCYAIGLPAYISTKVFATAHWAQQDTMTPVKIAVVSTAVNIALALVLIRFIGVAGIALATGLAGWVQFILYLFSLRGHKAAQFDARFKRVAPLIVLSSAAMAVTLYGLQAILERGVLELAILVGSGMFVYGGCCMVFGVMTPQELKQYLKRK